MWNNSGIYTITNKIDGKIYLGYSKDLYNRKRNHFDKLRDKTHPNIHLQRAFDKYGKEFFDFEVLENYPDEGFILSSMEHYWANLLNVHDSKYGYNIKPTHPYGKTIQSKETREKISKSNKGNTSSKGRVLTQEHKDKIGKSNSGKKQSRELIEKRLAIRKENDKTRIKKPSQRIKSKEEVSANISKSLKGKKRRPEAVAKSVATKKRMWEEKQEKLKLLKSNSYLD